MSKGGGKHTPKRVFSISSSAILILSTVFIGISIQVPNASGDSVFHDIGNVDIDLLTDYGMVLGPIGWGGNWQTAMDPIGFGPTGLVVDHDGYDHTPDSENIADAFLAYPYFMEDDFTIVTGITLTDDGTTQKSFASYENTGVGTGDPNDILINQTAWTVINEDWAIIQWSVLNQKGTDITNFRLSLEVPLSQVGAVEGVGGDSGDDIDGWDAGNNVYWAQDDGGTTIGFASAFESNPLNHYFSMDYHPPTYDDYKVYWENETWLYERITAPNSLEGGADPGNRTSNIGWSGVTIPAGSTKIFALAISLGNSNPNMLTAISAAQDYYLAEISVFRITEFSDSSSAAKQIEIFNLGAPTTNLTDEGYFLSLDGINPLSGTWSKNPLPPGEYSVFAVDPGETIGPEGDTIGLYQDLGGGNIILSDRVSFGLQGTAPDPLNGESTARRYESSISSYTDEWLRNASSGPTWGAENNVLGIIPSPEVILNEVMFNPGNPELGFIELMYTGGGSEDLLGYNIICDTEYHISSSIVLNPSNQFHLVEFGDDPAFFGQMDSTGDNVYLYDDTGRLLDMLGWSSPHMQSMSVRRTPEGTGTYQGYNDTSSEAAGWLFDNPLEVIMTEISDGKSGIAQIEIYNPDYPPINFSLGGFTFDSESSGGLPGTWSIPQVTGGGHAVFDSGVSLGFEGDVITLNQNGLFIEEISYGQKGTIPDPLSGESVQRFWDGSEYTEVWERNYTTGPNFGGQNNVPMADFGSDIMLNEVVFFPNVFDEVFVEIYNRGGVPIDISGCRIVCDSEYTIPPGTSVAPDDPYYYFVYNMDSTFFGDMDSTGDNIYLYDAKGSLLDMVGWSSQHTIGESVSRSLDGYGTRDGFNDTSSTAAGWVFDRSPTMRIILLNSQSQFEYGDFRGVVYFNLTVTNKQSQNDTINLFNTTVNGYQVSILDEFATIPISEIYVAAGATVNIKIKVILPSEIPFYEWENVTITIQSQNNSNYGDSILLMVVVSAPLVYTGSDITVNEGEMVQFNSTAYTRKSYPCWPVDISGDGRYIAIGWNKNVTFFSTKSNLPLWTYDIGGAGRVGDVKLSNDGRYLAVGCYISVYFFDTMTGIPLWSVAIGEPSTVRYDGDPGNRVDMTSDGRYIAAAAGSGYVTVYDTWNTTPTVPYWDYSFGGEVNVVRFSGDGRYLSMCNKNNQIKLGWIPDRIINWTYNAGDMVYSSSLSYDGGKISSGEGNNHHVRLYNSGSPTPVWTCNLNGRQFEQVMSSDGNYLASSNHDDGGGGSWSGFAFWDTSSSAPIWTYSVGTGPMSSADAIDMDHDANYVAGGANDRKVYLFSKLSDGNISWSSSDGLPVFTYTTGDVIRYNGVSISDDGTYFACGSWDSGVYLFTTAGGPHLEWSWYNRVLNPAVDPMNLRWDFNNFVDSDGDGNMTNDIDATGPNPTYIFGDDGNYTVTLSLWEGATLLGIDNMTVTVNNLPPTIDPFGPFDVEGGDPLDIDASASDPGSDDLTFTWSWGDGTPDDMVVYYNDGMGPDPYPSPSGTFPFIAIDSIQHTYGFNGVFIINLTVMDDDGGIAVYSTNVTVDSFPPLPPTLFINVSLDGKDSVLYWIPPPIPWIDHYLIYRSTTQVDFDFNTVWVNTSEDVEFGESTPFPLRTMWNDTNAAFPGNTTNYEEQYYYIIRTVNQKGEVSRTSRTVGKWTREFPRGVSSFSLPLAPFSNCTVDDLTTGMDAEYIRYLEFSDRKWRRHDQGMGSTNNTLMRLGEGYEVNFASQTNFTFTGMPGAMISYCDKPFGFDADPQTGDAGNLSVSVDDNGDVTLTWETPQNTDDNITYWIYRSEKRDGFWGTAGIDYQEIGCFNLCTPGSWIFAIDPGIALPGTEHYYMIVPIHNITGERGVGSYSVGIWVEEYYGGYDTFGVPLKLPYNETADWFCDSIPDTIGINYFSMNYGIWLWHHTRMAKGAFDPIIEMGIGYQISTSGPTKFAFIGI